MDQDTILALAGMAAFFSIPAVAILTYHQRKMAEIIHGKGRQGQSSANDTMAAEMHQLRQAIHQQTIALDSLTSEIKKGIRSPNEPLSSRLSEDSLQQGR